ncbi:hypothetical protein [Streptomyces fractus]|uniref:hypothetical protein n=1 Tax=Streptomyces fractus TaxID=641806 RepID=UPI003CE866F5
MSELTTPQRQILAACERHLAAQQQWDARPQILVVKLGRGADGDLRVRELPVPDVIWDAAPVPDVVEAFAAASMRAGSPAGPDVMALALCTEVHALAEDTSPHAAEVIRRRMAGGSTPSIKDLPGCVQQRLIFAMDWQGAHYFATTDRRPDGGSTAPHGRVETGGRPEHRAHPAGPGPTRRRRPALPAGRSPRRHTPPRRQRLLTPPP